MDPPSTPSALHVPPRPGVSLSGPFRLVGLHPCSSPNKDRRIPVAAGKAVFPGLDGFVEVVIYDQRVKECLAKLEGCWFWGTVNLRNPRAMPQVDAERMVIHDLRTLQRATAPGPGGPSVVSGLGIVGEMATETFSDRQMATELFETVFERDGSREVRAHSFFWMLPAENVVAMTELLIQTKNKLTAWSGKLADVVVMTAAGDFETRAVVELTSVTPVDERAMQSRRE